MNNVSANVRLQTSAALKYCDVAWSTHAMLGKPFFTFQIISSFCSNFIQLKSSKNGQNIFFLLASTLVSGYWKSVLNSMGGLYGWFLWVVSVLFFRAFLCLFLCLFPCLFSVPFFCAYFPCLFPVLIFMPFFMPFLCLFSVSFFHAYFAVPKALTPVFSGLILPKDKS